MTIKLGQKITDNDDDLHRGPKSTEVKYGNLCSMVSTFGSHWTQATDDDDLYGGQKSTGVKYSKLSSMATKRG